MCRRDAVYNVLTPGVLGRKSYTQRGKAMEKERELAIELAIERELVEYHTIAYSLYRNMY